MTVLFVLTNLVVFGYELSLLMQGGDVAGAFVGRHALVPARLIAGWQEQDEWGTLVTHLFLHGGVAHVVGNCWFLWVFGRAVEDRFGSVRFTIFYLVSGLGAAGLQVLVEPGATLPMIGASGAISGVLGAFFVLMPTAWVVGLVPWIVPILPVPAFVFLIVWFALQALNGVGVLMTGSTGGGVAWWAHAGGFATGVCLTVWARGKRWLRR